MTTLRQDVQPMRHTYFLPTVEMRNHLAALYVRLGYKYVIGWFDVQGWALQVTRNVEWIGASGAPYVDL